MPATESSRLNDLSDSEPDQPGTTEIAKAKSKGRPRGKAKTSPKTPNKKDQIEVAPKTPKTPSKSHASDSVPGDAKSPPPKTEPRTPLKRPASSLKIMKKPSSAVAPKEPNEAKASRKTHRAEDHGVGRALYVESDGLTYFNMRYPKSGKVSIRIKDTKKIVFNVSWRLSDLNITAIL